NTLERLIFHRKLKLKMMVIFSYSKDKAGFPQCSHDNAGVFRPMEPFFCSHDIDGFFPFSRDKAGSNLALRIISWVARHVARYAGRHRPDRLVMNRQTQDDGETSQQKFSKANTKMLSR
ncbi:hypothetical protein BaRGS_00012422, partial [Batillaria attramentaria]